MGAFADNVTLWPQGIIPFVPQVTHPYWDTIHRAIRELNEKTDLQFIERTNEANYVFFTSDPIGNQSNVGMTGNSQRVNIDKNVRSLHELGHVAGMIHEQQRSDRDDFIELTDNLDFSPFVMDNIRTKLEMEGATEAYDLDSFQQYWDTAGSKDGQRTMIWKQNRDRRFDTPERLSSLDIKCINDRYAGEFDRRRTAEDATQALEQLGVLDPESSFYLFNPLSKMHIFVSNDQYGSPRDNVVEAHRAVDEARNLFQLEQVEGTGRFRLYNPTYKMYLFVSNDLYGSPADNLVEAHGTQYRGEERNEFVFEYCGYGNRFRLYNPAYKKYLFVGNDQMGNPPDRVVEAHQVEYKSEIRNFFDLAIAR